jgi:hypothetical protein
VEQRPYLLTQDGKIADHAAVSGIVVPAQTG